MKKTIINGNCLEVLRALPANYFQVIVTSPPYWNQRNYGTPPQIWPSSILPCSGEHEWQTVKRRHTSGSKEGSTLQGSNEAQDNSGTRETAYSHICKICQAWRGELGQEPTPKLFVEHLLLVFEELFRVLRDDGCLWLNIDDSSAASGHGHGGGSISEAGNHQEKTGGYKGRLAPECWKLKRKDLCLIPERTLIALQEMGFYVRSKIVWYKPNPIPESAPDRPSEAWEPIYLLTKSEHYFYDGHAIKVPVKDDTIARELRGRNANWKHSTNEHLATGQPAQTLATESRPNRTGHVSDQPVCVANKKNVWTMSVANFKDAHFATFPTEIPKTAILASTSAFGCCDKCGAPVERIIEKGAADLKAQKACGGNAEGKYNGKAKRIVAGTKAQDASAVKSRVLEGMRLKKTVGWKMTCDCYGEMQFEGDEDRSCEFADGKMISDLIKPCRVLDPFCGSGTTGEVALELAMDFTGIEVGPQYIPMINRRTSQTGLGLVV